MIKAKLDCGQSATALLVGDSLTGNQTFMYAYRIAELLAAKYPCAKVVFISRSNGVISPTLDTVVQAGSTAQTITVIRDGIPGATSYRADNSATIFSQPADLVSIYLGVNDAVNWFTPCQYTPQAYIDNIGYMGRYAREMLCCDVLLITPAWSEDSITQKACIFQAAAYARYIARKNGFGLLDARRIFEDHYTGTGNAGQGDWFADPTDHTHFGREGHYAIADDFMRQLGY
jgi:lysophospholipase L1-like esterase